MVITIIEALAKQKGVRSDLFMTLHKKIHSHCDVPHIADMQCVLKSTANGMPSIKFESEGCLYFGQRKGISNHSNVYNYTGYCTPSLTIL